MKSKMSVGSNINYLFLVFEILFKNAFVNVVKYHGFGLVYVAPYTPQCHHLLPLVPTNSS